MFIPGLRRNEQWVYHKAIEGLDSNRKDLDLTDKGDIVQNVRFNNEVGSVTKRLSVAYYNTSVESSGINSIYRYYNQSSSAAYVITSMGNTIRATSTGTFSTIYTMSGSSRKFTAVTYKDLAILSNGFDNILQTDGTVVWELGACKAALATGATGEMTAGVHYYTVVFTLGSDVVNGAVSNTVTNTADADRVTLSYIPLGATGTTARVIYRTAAAGSSLLKLHTLADNSTTTWTDTSKDSGTISSAATADAGASVEFTCSANHGLQTGDWVTIAGTTDYNGEEQVTYVSATKFKIVDTWVSNQSGTWAGGSVIGAVTDDMPKCKYLSVDQERLFAACDTVSGRGSYIYYSDQYLPHWIHTGTVDLTTTLPADYYERFAPDDGDIITGLVNFLGINYVFKQNSIRPWYVKGTPDTWEVGSVISPTGSPAPRSITVSPYGIIYLGWDHFYLFNGQQATPIIDDVNIYETILDSRRYETDGFFWNNLYLAPYTDLNNGNAYHDRVLVYDMLRKQASIDKGGSLASGRMNIGCFTSFKGSAEWGQLYGGDSVLGWVYQYDREQNYTNLNSKSGIDLGTHSNTMAVGEDNNPILSKFVLDNMETYTNNSLAQIGWVTSLTTVFSKKVPPDLGDGTDGSKTVSTDDTLSVGTYDYTDLTIAAGKKLVCAKGTIIKCLGTVTVNGTLYAGGSLTIYAHTITVAAAGIIGGALTLRANTINNSGLITGDAIRAVANLWDDNFATFAAAGQGIYMQDNWGPNTAIITFIAESDIAYTKYKAEANYIIGYTEANASLGSTVLFNVGPGGTGETTGEVTNGLGKSGALTASYYVRAVNGYGGSCWAAIYELQTIMGEPIIDYLNGSVGTIRPTPVAASTTDYVYGLECFSETDIVNEGTYALKVVCPAGADTLDQYLTKTISSIDLNASPNDHLLVDIYALTIHVTKSYFKIGLYDSVTGGGTWTDVACPITTSNTWTTLNLDFGAVTDKTAITKMRIIFSNTDNTATDAGNVVYLDNIRTALYASATYTSPCFDINAKTMGKMYWNEDLAVVGDITYGDVVISTRSGAYLDAAGTAPSDTNGGSTKTWHATTLTDPSGSTIASTAARYFQFKAVFTSTDTTGIYFPYIYKADGYCMKFTYYKVSTAAETAVEFIFRTGWHNFDLPADDKIYRKIISVHKAPEVAGTFNLIVEADKSNTQTYTFSGIDLADYPYRFLSNLPSNMYGKELRVEWYNDDVHEFAIQQYGVLVEDVPLI